MNSPTAALGSDCNALLLRSATRLPNASMAPGERPAALLPKVATWASEKAVIALMLSAATPALVKPATRVPSKATSVGFNPATAVGASAETAPELRPLKLVPSAARSFELSPAAFVPIALA